MLPEAEASAAIFRGWTVGGLIAVDASAPMKSTSSVNADLPGGLAFSGRLSLPGRGADSTSGGAEAVRGLSNSNTGTALPTP